jgi:hypothetical protein
MRANHSFAPPALLTGSWESRDEQSRVFACHDPHAAVQARPARHTCILVHHVLEPRSTRVLLQQRSRDCGITSACLLYPPLQAWRTSQEAFSKLFERGVRAGCRLQFYYNSMLIVRAVLAAGCECGRTIPVWSQTTETLPTQPTLALPPAAHLRLIMHRSRCLSPLARSAAHCAICTAGHRPTPGAGQKTESIIRFRIVGVIWSET